MNTVLDLYDIQGNIMKNYADFGLFKARYLFFTITKIDSGKGFVQKLLPFITNASLWFDDNTFPSDKGVPKVTTNVSFTYNGLKRLGVPVQTLQSFPEEFIMGMRGRRAILGDNDVSDPKHWDPVWHKDIHIFVSIDAKTDEALQQRYSDIIALLQGNEGVELLSGHRAENSEDNVYQDVSVLYDKGIPTSKEHFGYSDGISNPFFKGMTDEMGELLGGGKKSNVGNNGYGNPELESTWEPLETGEFILGYKDEAQEYPLAPMPPLMAKNGSFLVYRKLHENVGKFNDFLDKTSQKSGMDKELLAAKLVGRWRNGVPITTYPKKEDAEKIAQQRQQALLTMTTAQTAPEQREARKALKEITKKFIAFDYQKDIQGGRCPVGAHTRRANPRGSLEFGKDHAFDTPSALDNRRRLIRRGLPYGKAQTPDSNDGNHGTIVMTIQASIKRQFEFVQQQWINYGNDFKLGNDKDSLLGNHSEVNGKGDGRMVFESDNKEQPPYFLQDLPRFIVARGGEYFFIPSLTALRMIAEGIVDPT